MSKADILKAAQDLLWERGYESMSPRLVMDRSGSGQGSLYHHFRSKQALAEAALAVTGQEALAAVEPALTSDKPPLERIREYLTLERNGLRGCRIGRLANEAEVLAQDGLRDRLAHYFVRVEALLVGALAEARTRGEIPLTLDIPAVAAALAASVQGGYVISRALNDPDAVTRATEGAFALLEAAVK